MPLLGRVPTAEGYPAVVLLPKVSRSGAMAFMRRTRFGTTLVFDSTDADGTPVRLLNVNGTFQSVCYTQPELRFELACMQDIVADRYLSSPVHEDSCRPRRAGRILQRACATPHIHGSSRR